MENRTLNTENLRLARIKYFDTKHNGAEICDEEAYAFLFAFGGNYLNVFNPADNLPIYDRAPYANVAKNGMNYGNKLFHISGDVKDGPCYVIEPYSVKSLVGKDTITMEELREYVLASKKYFVDRIALINEEKGPRRFTLSPILKETMQQKKAFDKYMASHVGYDNFQK